MRLGNSLETLPAGVWSELTSGRSCATTGLYFYSRQLHSGETGFRAVQPEEADPTAYWTTASEAGCRVAALDMTMTVRAPGLNGVQLLEWGTHDRVFREDSEPAGLLGEVRARYGSHPVHDGFRTCDDHGRRPDGYEDVLDRLLAGVERKTELLRGFLDAERWDLFSCTFAEAHCVGHQFWHFLDASPAEATARLRDAIRSVYARIDAGVAELLRAAGPDAAVLVVASHGMGPLTGGFQLLPEVIVRLGFGSGAGPLARTRSRLPRGARRLARRMTPRSLRGPLQTAAGSLPAPLASPRTRAIALHNDRIGAIRLNLRGRDPFGSVEPDVEADALVSELREELLRLVDPTSGERIVEEVVAGEEVFGADRHPNLPDVLVRFRVDLGLIEACTSPRAGTVRVGAARHRVPRTGEHTPESRLWMLGPTAEPGTGGDGHALDVAPTVLSLLGVPVPSWMEGRALTPASAMAP